VQPRTDFHCRSAAPTGAYRAAAEAGHKQPRQPFYGREYNADEAIPPLLCLYRRDFDLRYGYLAETGGTFILSSMSLDEHQQLARSNI
jgi:hypothetical protein